VVNGLLVGGQTQLRVVAHVALDRGCERHARDLADARIPPRRLRVDLGRAGIGSERAHVFRNRVGLARAFVAQQLSEHRQQVVRGVLRELDLELAEAADNVGSVDHANVVFDDLG
jgi:hypothetical protein